MKLCLMLSTFMLCSVLCKGQNSASLSGKPDEIPSTLYYQNKADSLATFFYQNVDSLREKYKTRLSTLDSVHNSLTKKLQQPAHLESSLSKVKSAGDSVNNLINSLVLKVNSGLDSLKQKFNTEFNKIDFPDELDEKMQPFTSRINEFNIQELSDHAGLPASITDINIKPGMTIPALGNLSGLAGSDAGQYLGQLNDVSTLAKSDPQQLVTAAENKLSDLSGLGDLQSQTNLEEYQNVLNKVHDTEAAKEAAVDKLQQEAFNHFSGKEKVLESAIDAMNKYKRKFNSLNDIKNRPRRPPNEMRGKPLIERLVLSVSFQVQKKENVYVSDINPAIGYRITHKFNAGIGWNMRFAYNASSKTFDHALNVYGPRAFSEFNAWKGFFPRVEIETMKTFVPSSLQNPIDRQERKWITGAYAGIKKEYTLFKNIKGSVLLMARIYNGGEKLPNHQIVNLRVGVEIPLKKRL